VFLDVEIPRRGGFELLGNQGSANDGRSWQVPDGT
jgi:hypothetical protein